MKTLHDTRKTLACSFICSLLICLCTTTSIYAQAPIQVSGEKIIYRELLEILRAQGNVEAKNVARVSPRISGPIDAIFVKEGDQVEAGKTRLFVIDPLKLEKNLEIRRQETIIAGLSLKEKETRLKQALADFEKARRDVNRSQLLWEDKSTSQDNLEKAQLKLRVSETALEHIRTLIELDREQLKKAEIALDIAEKDFADSTVLAPLSGRISTKLQEPGEMATPGKPILIIKDPDNTEVSAYMPAEYYHLVEVDSTPVIIKSYNSNEIETVVTFKSPEISTELRTFQIKCPIKQGQKSPVPGTLVDLRLVLSRKRSLAVPATAILNRDNGKVIFVVTEDRARMVRVATGIEYEGFCEIVAENLKEGDIVVVKGQHLLNDGQNIQLQTDRGVKP